MLSIGILRLPGWGRGAGAPLCVLCLVLLARLVEEVQSPQTCVGAGRCRQAPWALRHWLSLWLLWR